MSNLNIDQEQRHPRPAALLHERVALNPRFFHRLADIAPDLTVMEFRIVTMLRLSMRTPEIARHLGIAEHTVENHRSKVRKKLGITPDRNLYMFLASLH